MDGFPLLDFLFTGFFFFFFYIAARSSPHSPSFAETKGGMTYIQLSSECALVLETLESSRKGRGEVPGNKGKVFCK